MSDEEIDACSCDGFRPVELADSLEIQRDFNDAFNSEREVAQIRISPWDRIFLQEMTDAFWAVMRSKGWLNHSENAGPWATSGLWRKR